MFSEAKFNIKEKKYDYSKQLLNMRDNVAYLFVCVCVFVGASECFIEIA